MPNRLFLLAPLLLLAACAQPPKTDTPMPGSDRDVHGCIPSAGYSWCQRESACVHPWELATEKKFDNNADAFKAYCGKQ